MAGTLDLLTRCYPGLDLRDGVLRLDPELPVGLDRLSFVLRPRGHRDLRLSCHGRRVRITVPPSTAPPVTVEARGRTVRVPAGHERVLPPADDRRDGGPGR